MCPHGACESFPQRNLIGCICLHCDLEILQIPLSVLQILFAYHDLQQTIEMLQSLREAHE